MTRSVRKDGAQAQGLPRSRFPSGKQAGAALILVLTCLLALSGAVLLDEERSLDKYQSVRLLGEEYKADLLAESGLRAALTLLQEDISLSSDTQSEPWAEPVALGPVKISIEPCNARLNLNNLVLDGLSTQTSQALKRMFLDKDYYPEYVDALTDWLDADRGERVLSAEGQWYELNKLGYSPPNRKFEVLEEALLVQGWRDIDTAWFEQYFTIWDDSGRLNLNFVSEEVLKAYLPRLAIYWHKIKEYRSHEKGISRIDQLLGILQGNDVLYQDVVRFVTVRSEYFQVIIEVDLPLVYEKHRYIVKREEDVLRRDVLEIRIKGEAEAF